MSVCSVVPDCSISSAASLDPIRTISGDTVFPSAGKMYFSSQSISARSSARPRYMTMGAWPCVLIRPGNTTMPPAWMTSAAAKRVAIASGVSTATIVFPLIATAPGDRTRRWASMVITVPPVTTSVARLRTGGAAESATAASTHDRAMTTVRREARDGAGCAIMPGILPYGAR